MAACVIQDSQLGSIRLSIDTIDYVNGIGNTPMHSIENVLFQCNMYNLVLSVVFFFVNLSLESLRSPKLTGNF